MNEIDSVLFKASLTLREVTQTLADGVDRREFEQRYRGKFVSPGVSVRRYVENLRIAGSLEEDGERIRLRSEPVAVSA